MYLLYILYFFLAHIVKLGHWGHVQLALVSLWHFLIMVFLFLFSLFVYFFSFWHYKILQAHLGWKLNSLGHVWLFVTPWTILTMEFPGQNTGVGSLSLLQGIFPTQESNFRSPTRQEDSLPAEPPGKPKNPGVGSLALLQRIFPTRELNQGLLHCRRILYQLSYQGLAYFLPSPRISNFSKNLWFFL